MLKTSMTNFMYSRARQLGECHNTHNNSHSTTRHYRTSTLAPWKPVFNTHLFMTKSPEIQPANNEGLLYLVSVGNFICLFAFFFYRLLSNVRNLARDCHGAPSPAFCRTCLTTAVTSHTSRRGAWRVPVTVKTSTRCC